MDECMFERETSTYICYDNKMSGNHKVILSNFCILLISDDVCICCLYIFNKIAQQEC